MKHIRIILFLFTLLVTNIANGQYFQTGQDPSHLRWRQINTPQFQVIYPEEFDKEAQRLTYVLSKVYEYGTQTMNFNPRKISVVLHTRTVQSNGLVAWAPKRVELFTTPHQQIYSQDWLEQLALHEFRHVIQMDKIQSELPLILKILLGEQATAIVTGVYLPLWFLEGDAVVSETALSPSGRGRMASFSMEYRAQLAEKGKYSFNKAFLGSFKDFVPDHYALGYWMVGKTRAQYGSQIWSKVVEKAGSQPLSISPMNAVLKKQTGMNSKQLYHQIFNELAGEWKQSNNSDVNNSPSTVSPLRKSYTDYRYAEFYLDSFIIAYRTSLDDIGRFVMISPDQSEKIIYTPGSVFEESVSMKDQLLIWAERRADIRWTHADRSVILVYNIETRQKHEISYENKLFSPVISPDLKSFAAVEVDPENNIYLSVFDLDSGKAKQRFKTKDNQYFFTPCWDETGDRLYVVSLSSKGKSLNVFDLRTKEFNPLTSLTWGNLKNPVFINGQIIFSADFSGTDHLYAVDTESHEIFQIHSANFGADYPSGANSKNQILFSNYTSRGYQLSVLNLSEKENQKKVMDISLQSNPLADKLTVHEKGIPDFNNTDSTRYESEKYSKWGHLFNFHSWAPAYIDINSNEIRPGVSLFSQNDLGTAETRIGYDYNVADRTGKGSIEFSYFGLFPEFNTQLSYGKGASQYYQITNTVNQFNQIIDRDTVVQRYTWNELSADLDIRLPLNLSKGKYSTAIFPEVKYTLNQYTPDGSSPDNFSSKIYHAMTYRLNYYQLLRQSRQNIQPKWGHQLDLVFRHTPFAGNDLGTIAGVQTVLYFPGLAKNNGIKIYQAFQKKSYSQRSNFSNVVRFPRGFHGLENNKMYSFAADYVMPLAYPDLNMGKLAYFKRIKSSVFYDFANLWIPLLDENQGIIPNHHQLNLNSLGLELTSDLHILRFFAPLEIGVRSIYLPDSNAFRFDFLFSIDFNGF